MRLAAPVAAAVDRDSKDTVTAAARRGCPSAGHHLPLHSLLSWKHNTYPCTLSLFLSFVLSHPLFSLNSSLEFGSLFFSLSLSLSLCSSDGEDHHVETQRQRRQQQNSRNGMPHMERVWTAAVVSLRPSGLGPIIIALLRTWPLGLSNAHLDAPHSYFTLPSSPFSLLFSLFFFYFFSLMIFGLLISDSLYWNRSCRSIYHPGYFQILISQFAYFKVAFFYPCFGYCLLNTYFGFFLFGWDSSFFCSRFLIDL